MNTPLLLSLGSLTLCALFWFASNSRASTETSVYRVVRTAGKLEIRDYPERIVASTPMDERGMNGSFGHLFRFITGANADKEKISMTTPVLIEKGPGGQTMNFIMPAAAVRKGVPAPEGENVHLEKIKAARYAVLRFSGSRNAAHEKRAVEQLCTALKQQMLAASGEPVFAYYDPPWTPSWMRRNEVMLRLDE